MTTNEQIIGKSDHLRALNEWIRHAGDGNPKIIFISGPSGVGKTTLIQNIQHPGRFQYFQTNVFEEESPSYNVIANLLRQTDIVKAEVFRSHSELTDYIGYFLPEYRVNNIPEADFDLLLSLFRKMLHLVTKEKPLVWFIEDLHWADVASLEVLSGLITSSSEIPVAIIATYRNEHITRDHPVRKTRAKLRRNPWFSEIELQPFTENEICEFVSVKYSQKPHKDLVQSLHYQTNGLPLLVNEILNTLQKRHLLHITNDELQVNAIEKFPIPENIKDLVILQMDELSDEARDVAEIAASYSMEFAFTFLEHFVSSSMVIDELIEKSVIIEKSPGIGTFRHALYRDTIRSEILWSKRKNIYRRIAEELEKHPISPSVLAEFYHRAGLTAKARPAFIQSARESCDIFAYQDAARWAEKALNDWPKGEDEEERINILEEFAHCSKISGNLNNAIKALKEITESEFINAHPAKLAFIYRELASCYGLTGAWNNYQQSRIKAVELFNQSENYGESALEQLDLSEFYFKEIRCTESLKIIDEALTNATKANRNDIHTRCLAFKGYCLAFNGHDKKGFELANEAVNSALQQNDTVVTAEAYRRLAGALEYASSFTESLKAYDVAFNFCSTNQLDYHETQCMSCMAWVLMRVGDWRRCFETCRKVMDHKGTTDISKGTVNLIMALIRAYRGELKTAKKNLQETHRIAEQESSNLHHLLTFWPEAIIAMIEGNNTHAYQSFCNMFDFWSKTEDRHDSMAGFCDAISFFTIRKHPTEVNKCINALSYIANETKNPEAFGILSFAIGSSLVLKNETHQAIEHFEKALNYLKPVNIPLQLAIIEFHLAYAYQELHMGQKAEHAYDSSYHTFKNLGIRYWCSVIDQQKTQLTNQSNHNEPAETAGMSSSQLTGRQLEILNLLTTGLSNKEIANKIHLSTRTVDMHVRNIFDRLNCRSRAEATKIALDKRLV